MSTDLKFANQEYDYLIWTMFVDTKDVNKLKWNFDNLLKVNNQRTSPDFDRQEYKIQEKSIDKVNYTPKGDSQKSSDKSMKHNEDPKNLQLN